MAATPTAPGSEAELLAAVRAWEDEIATAEVGRVVAIRDWALAHTVEASDPDAATLFAGRDDTGMPLAGPGAPLVSEYALLELCAALGRSTDSGRAWVGKVLEVAFRLPRIWARVTTGRIPVWRALAIAERTLPLPQDAATYVDRHLAAFATGCTWAQIDRLVDEALVRFDPDTAQARRLEAGERRHLDIDTAHAAYEGTVQVHGELDLADGLDLEAAVARRARALGELGCEESFDVRRAKAAGELARADLTLDLTLDLDTTRPTDEDEPERAVKRSSRPGRRVELIVHLTDAVLAGRDPVARCHATNSPISPEQVREWCGLTGSTVIVRPVLDLAEHAPTEAYEIPDRIRRQVQLRDPHCVFPFCQRRAERCDVDHRHPYDSGGVTCHCNLAPLCRRHHRAKTHAGWTYTTIEPGSYAWTSPAGYHYLVDPHSSHDLDHSRPTPCPAAPD